MLNSRITLPQRTVASRSDLRRCSSWERTPTWPWPSRSPPRANLPLQPLTAQWNTSRDEISSGKCHGSRSHFCPSFVQLKISPHSSVVPSLTHFITLFVPDINCCYYFTDVPSTVKVRPCLRHPPSGLRDGRQCLWISRHESFKGGCSRD